MIKQRGVMLTSRDLSLKFGVVHRDICNRIKSIKDELLELSEGMFIESEYSVRGKSYSCYSISSKGIVVLLQYRMFSSSALHAEIKSNILSYYKIDHTVVIGRASRFEDSFYSMLCDFIGRNNIIRQFPVLNYRVDFFLKCCSLFIEYDEEQHLSKRASDDDAKRWDEISKEIESISGVKSKLIRVRKGGEITALSKIAACICREAPDWMIKEKEIEDYHVHVCD